uniref:Secreted protein n=1 Tax=Haemonchus contortus TaxID=6289 RepID=A0A7I4YPI3_HAECO
MLASRFQYVIAVVFILYTGGISAKREEPNSRPGSYSEEDAAASATDDYRGNHALNRNYLPETTTSGSTTSTSMTSTTEENSTPTITSTDGPSPERTTAGEGGKASGLTTPKEKPSPFEANTPGKGSNSSESSTSDYRSGEFKPTTPNGKSNSSELTTSDGQSVSTNWTISNNASGSSESTSPVGRPDKDSNSTDGVTTTPGKGSNLSEFAEPKGGPNLIAIVSGESVASGSQQSDSASAIGFSLLTVVLTKLILW